MLRYFRDGDEVVRTKLNEMVAALNALMQMRGDEQYITVSRTEAGVAVRLNVDNLLRRIPKYVPGAEGFWVQINSFTQDGANRRWTYTVTQVQRAAGGGWENMPDGWTGSAYNTIEDMNSSGADGHPWGNGVDSNNLLAGGTPPMTLQPAPAGAIVRVFPTVVPSTGAWELWFSYENAIDGACP